VLAIQGDTTAAVAAIEEISSIVAQISDRQTTIASAVEEQTATTNEMARNVAEAATGSTEIARNHRRGRQSVQETTGGATNTASAAGELSGWRVTCRSSWAAPLLTGRAAPGRPGSSAGPCRYRTDSLLG
jgi:methyl-accepting chemotaxis protein